MRFIRELEHQWNKRGRYQPIHAVMSLEEDGLVLGAGTVLAARDWTDPHANRLDPDTDASRLLALLSVTYDVSMPAWVLGNISRAAKQWERGENCLAAIHLALTGLTKLNNPREASRRLYIADGLLRHGIAPETVLNALEIDTGPLEALRKYSEDQPRVPAGNGIESGRWTAGGEGAAESFLGTMPAPAVSGLAGFLSRYSAEEIAVGAVEAGGELAVGAVAAFGLMLIPTPAGGRSQSGDIPGAPGFSYTWNDDEAELRILHDDGSKETVALTAQLGADGAFHASNGGTVGRLDAGRVVIDAEALSDRARTALDDADEPKLCPAYQPDKPGRDADGAETDKSAKDRAYEDLMKAQLNPGNPTPHAMAYALANPQQGGKPVIYDDCQQATGMMAEYKGTGYDALVDRIDPTKLEAINRMLRQANNQVDAIGDRRLTWFFAEQRMAIKMQELFRDSPELSRIRVVYAPF